jgi:hypothetical protein
VGFPLATQISLFNGCGAAARLAATQMLVDANQTAFPGLAVHAQLQQETLLTLPWTHEHMHRLVTTHHFGAV